MKKLMTVLVSAALLVPAYAFAQGKSCGDDPSCRCAQEKCADGKCTCQLGCCKDGGKAATCAEVVCADVKKPAEVKGCPCGKPEVK